MRNIFLWYIDRMTGEQDIQKFWSACLKKSRYPDEAKAKKYAKKSQDRTGTPIFVYACRFCGGFHLSHKLIKDKVLV